MKDMTMPPLPGSAAYFLDFDGCLVELAARPDAVVVPRGLTPLLARLGARGALALVSGRSVAELRRALPGLSVAMAGSHGAEHARGRGRIARLAVDRAVLARAVAAVRDAAAPIPGLLVEVKPVAVALHFRAAPAQAGRAAEIMAAVAQGAPGFHLHHGKMLIEMRPDGIGKGDAVGRFLRAEPFRGRTPVVMGDDLTDEPAFAVANRHGGVSIKVGPGPSCARHRLADPAAVRRYLTWAAA